MDIFRIIPKTLCYSKSIYLVAWLIVSFLTIRFIDGCQLQKNRMN